MSTTQQLEKLKTSDIWAKQHPLLRLLILFSSRARGDRDRNSDWDIAFLVDSDQADAATWFPGADLLRTLAESSQIPSDSIDLIDLSNCSDILAHFIAQEGKLIYEREPSEFERFRQRSLKAPAELKQFRQTQRDKVLQALERWGA